MTGAQIKRAQKFARDVAVMDARKGKLCGWSNHSPSYRDAHAAETARLQRVAPSKTNSALDP